MTAVRITSFDVAELAGVSQPTVSRALNGHTSVRPDVRQRVEAAANKLGYRVNARASNLRRGNTRTIALVVLFDEDEGIASLNPFFATLQAYIAAAAQDEGLSVLTLLQSEKRRDAEVLRAFLRFRAISASSTIALTVTARP